MSWSLKFAPSSTPVHYSQPHQAVQGPKPPILHLPLLVPRTNQSLCTGTPTTTMTATSALPHGHIGGNTVPPVAPGHRKVSPTTGPAIVSIDSPTLGEPVQTPYHHPGQHTMRRQLLMLVTGVNCQEPDRMEFSTLVFLEKAKILYI